MTAHTTLGRYVLLLLTLTCSCGDDGPSDPDPNPTAIVAGGDHTCAVLDTGGVRCWGDGDSGRLGYGNTNNIGDDELPSTAGDVQVGGAAVALAAGFHHTCAVLDTGAVRCWGRGDSGRLGYGNTNNIGDSVGNLPNSAGDVQIDGTAVALAAGGSSTCAVLDTGAVRCWGLNRDGQLGYGHTGDIGNNELPDSAGPVQLGGPAVAVSIGGSHTCAVLDTGAVRCWGLGNVGQLGYGNANTIGDNEHPDSVDPVQLGSSAVAVSAGIAHTCAVLDTGAVRCWGNSAQGQLGYGNTDTIGNDELPDSVDPVQLGGLAVAVSAGSYHTCALLDTGAVRCWGHNNFGQLGYGNTDNIGDDELPDSVDPVQLGGSAVAVSAGGDHTCALLDTGVVRCWGWGLRGQLGYGNTIVIGNDEFPDSAGDVPF